MSDSMYFPQTVEEFMESYKMVDSEEIYSNGIEYVPIFRMNQWFNENPNVINHDAKVRTDEIDDAIHHLENSKTNCHEDYIDGIDFAIGVLQSIRE